MPAKITVKDNGSLHVEGDVELFDMAGRKFDLAGRTLFKLCRCGASRNKPFCDGGHRAIGFTSEIAAFALQPPKT